MLHPALTRVMAIVLAILSLILLLVSVSGFSEADELKAADIRSHEKLVERIELYEQLRTELEGLTAYKEADARLEEREEAHESEASQHRTDVATHSATEGGYQSGADMLLEKRAELEAQKKSYDAGLREFNQKEAEFNQQKAAVSALSTLAAACSAAALQQSTTTPVADPGAAPAPPTAPNPPMQPIDPLPPDPAAFEDDAVYQQALAVYEAAVAQKPALDEAYNAALTQYNFDYANYEVAAAAYPEQKAAYDVALAEYQAYAAKLAAWSALEQQAAAALSAMGVPAPAGLAAVGASLQAAYDTAWPAIEDGEKLLKEGKQQLEAAGEQLEAGEWAIRGNLENIWWNMGELDKEADELGEERDQLKEQSAQLNAEREVLEKQKEAENKLSSTRILLMQNEPIAQAVDAGGDIIEVSRSYADDSKLEYERLYKGRRILYALAAAASVLSLLVLPAAFEKIKNRALLLLPAILSFAGALAAVLYCQQLGLDQFYAAMPVVIFAPLYLLAAFGKKKIITE